MKKEELFLRHSKIREALEKSGAEGILLSSNVNMFYSVGQIFIGYVFISVYGDFTIFSRMPIDGSTEFRNAGDIAAYIKEHYKRVHSITFDDEYMSAVEFFRIEAAFSNFELKKNLNIMRRARMIKTNAELDAMRKSADLQCSLYEKIPSLFRAGMTDIEFSAEIEKQARLLGHLGIFRSFGGKMELFMGSLLAGENAGAPSPFDFALGGKGVHPSVPIGACGCVISPGQTVMADISGNAQGYLCDMTRVFSYGDIPEKACKLHNISLEILDNAEKILTAGTRCFDIWNKVVEIVKKYGVQDCFMGKSKQAKFVGHSLGLEINELPVLTGRDETLLAEGMVLAIEPKFVLPGVGAVGAEDTYIITAGVPERITVAPREILHLG